MKAQHKRSHAGKSTGPKNGGTYLARAIEKWGSPPPDWIVALAGALDSGLSQPTAGAKIGVSGGAISAVLSRSYAGRMDRVEARVRGALMQATVVCPVEGAIPKNRCADNQVLKPSAASPARARFPHACKGCPNAFKAAVQEEQKSC